MGKLIDALERLMFGATAQERVDLMARLVELRMTARLVAALEADESADSADDDASVDGASSEGGAEE